MRAERCISTLSNYRDVAWHQRGSDNFQRFAKAEVFQRSEFVRGDSSSAPAWTFIPKVHVGVAPNEVDVGVAPCVGDRPSPGVCGLRRSTDRQRRPPKQNCHTDSGHSNTDFHHRFTGSATAARHTVVTSIGVATAPTENQPHHPGHDQHRLGNTRLLCHRGPSAPAVQHRPGNPRYGCPRTKLQQRNNSGLPANR